MSKSALLPANVPPLTLCIAPGKFTEARIDEEEISSAIVLP